MRDGLPLQAEGQDFSKLPGHASDQQRVVLGQFCATSTTKCICAGRKREQQERRIKRARQLSGVLRQAPSRTVPLFRSLACAHVDAMRGHMVSSEALYCLSTVVLSTCPVQSPLNVHMSGTRSTATRARLRRKPKGKFKVNQQ